MKKIIEYSPGTKEREQLVKEIQRIKNESPVEMPLIIGGKEVKTDEIIEIRCPHNKDLVLARAHLAGKEELKEAIEKALDAWEKWSEMEWYHRVSVFRRAADLLAKKYRFRNIAAIMLNLSKNPYEAEIDLAELVDFWRFNSYYAKFIYEHQPDQAPGELNRLEWRPLEGFILAVTPFNFYSIGGNLPTAPAIVGNVTLWKPSRSVIFANYEIMKILIEAGLPKGVVNFVPFSSKNVDVVLSNPDFAGLHFTGSYETLVVLWKKISENLEKYKNFPRIVGETGGKDFIIVHPSANVKSVVANLIRGAFESQGQKCSAISRAYIPQSLWAMIKESLLSELQKVKVGPVDDLESFMGAVIDGNAFRKIVSYIEYAKSNPETYKIIYGGHYDSSKGWFIEPTVILTSDPQGKLMTEEIFGPVLTIYVYPDERWHQILKLCAETSPFGLTGAVFANDRNAIVEAERILRYSAGNFYINDKPTGAIVGRQPFGGARHSGTNDKAGFWLNLLRWLNPRTIKETTLPVEDWRRPFQAH
ncbi:L-glutamate gamma-semialdehyde dehydrogenase [Thermococcus sp.]